MGKRETGSLILDTGHTGKQMGVNLGDAVNLLTFLFFGLPS